MTGRNHAFMLGRLEYVTAALVRAIERGGVRPDPYTEDLLREVRQVLAEVASPAAATGQEATR